MPHVARASRLRILTYHSVDRAPHDDHTVTPEQLKAHLAALASSGWRTMSADEVDSAVATASPWRGRRRAVVTFDDGYEDFLLEAWPILKEHDYSVCLFVVTDFVGKTDAFNGTSRPRRMLSWEQLRELARAGLEIGSHGCSHRKLPELPPDLIESEVRDSRRRLEDGVGVQVRYLAYPYGEATEEVARAVERAGYRAAFTGPGPMTSRYRFPRVAVGGRDSALRLRVKLTSAYRLARRAARLYGPS